MKNEIRAVLLLALAAGVVGTASADTDVFTVPEGTTVTLEASAVNGTNDVRGTLIVPSGKSVYSQTATWLGRTGDAVIRVNGGTFGHDGDGNNTSWYPMTVGEEGGRAAVELTNGGKCAGGTFSIKAATEAHESGYVDILTSTGNNTWSTGGSCRYNGTAYTARIRVLSGTLTDKIGGAGYYCTRFNTGSWLYEIASGATLAFDQSYRVSTFNASGKSVKFEGEGKVTHRLDNGWPVNNGVEFNNAGGFTCGSNKTITFNDGVKFGDSFGLLKVAGTTRFGGNVNLGSVEVTGSGTLKAVDAKSPVITFGTADRDATLTGAVFADDCGLTLVKTGSGALTTSATTPYLPAMALNEGSLVIKGTFSCSNLTMAAGTSVVVDGGVWTIDGNQLTQASGSTISVNNGGAIIVKTVGESAPTFAPFAEVGMIPVQEYWVDGERQRNGYYWIGNGAINVYKYEEGDDIWSNRFKSGDDWPFGSKEEYKGFDLVKTDGAPRTFVSDGPLTLGSAGIVVENTETPATFNFDMSLYAPVNQLWSFGEASVNFTRPFAALGSQSARVGISSLRNVTLATTNSTYTGAFSVTGETVTVSGRHPFGVGTANCNVKVNGANKRIVLRDVEFTQAVGFDYGGGSSFDNWYFYGTNLLKYVNFGDNNSRCTFKANSETTFASSVERYNFNACRMESGSRIIYKGPVRLYGYAASKVYGVIPTYGATVQPVVRFEAQNNLEDDGTYFIHVYGKSQSVLGARVETACEYAFDKGWFIVDENSTLDLCGFNQRFTRVDAKSDANGLGEVTSATPAQLELAPGAGVTVTNRMTFSGQAGLTMAGAGTVRQTGPFNSSGSISVESGTVEIATNCLAATSVSVADGGHLVVERPQAFDRNLVLSLAGVGALANRSGGDIRVGRLTLVNPSTGNPEVHTTGVFTPENSHGLISEGVVRAGRQGTILYVR